MRSNIQVDQNASYYQSMGEVVSVMLQSSKHRKLQIAGVGVWIAPALMLNQFQLLRDETNTPYSYICWASVSSEVLEKLRRCPQSMLHISEWNEGEVRWVVDFAVREGMQSKALQELSKLYGSLWDQLAFFDGIRVRNITMATAFRFLKLKESMSLR